jgi:hypothetical protein
MISSTNFSSTVRFGHLRECVSPGGGGSQAEDRRGLGARQVALKKSQKSHMDYTKLTLAEAS